MKTVRSIVCAAMTAVVCPTFAQSKEHNPNVEVKPIVTLMPGFYSGLFAERESRGFALDRSYFGVQGKLGDELTFKTVVDCGKSSDVDDYQRLVYVKNAMFAWSLRAFRLSAGLISTNHFGTQEKYWGKRYVMKSFADEYKFGSSADLGISAEVKPVKWFAVDAIIANGEGYKKLQVKHGLLYGLGATFRPTDNWLIRLYADVNEDSNGGVAKKSAVAMVGYKSSRFVLAVEGNFLFDVSADRAKDERGISAYGAVSVGKRSEIFVRYDALGSRRDWNVEKDGSMALVGAEVKIGRYVKVSPNFRLWNAKEKGADNAPYIYVNTVFNL